MIVVGGGPAGYVCAIRAPSSGSPPPWSSGTSSAGSASTSAASPPRRCCTAPTSPTWSLTTPRISAIEVGEVKTRLRRRHAALAQGLGAELQGRRVPDEEAQDHRHQGHRRAGQEPDGEGGRTTTYEAKKAVVIATGSRVKGIPQIGLEINKTHGHQLGRGAVPGAGAQDHRHRRRGRGRVRVRRHLQRLRHARSR